ncbi:hypothetical protein DLP3_084 [Stenotrophomonas phage vB_SmaS_DLP_3]|nr:hypothetical protein DLP3_084 [Stenotrophomonas phage vB_SmaS_DLP_3]
MSKYGKWLFKPGVKVAKTKGDRVWWVKDRRGHKVTCLIGLQLIDVASSGNMLFRKGEKLGQAVYVVIGPVRIGLLMRFTQEALDRKAKE